MYWNGGTSADGWSTVGLIETWDVLKCTYMTAGIAAAVGLIETWDVLK